MTRFFGSHFFQLQWIASTRYCKKQDVQLLICDRPETMRQRTKSWLNTGTSVLARIIRRARRSWTKQMRIPTKSEETINVVHNATDTMLFYAPRVIPYSHQQSLYIFLSCFSVGSKEANSQRIFSHAFFLRLFDQQWKVEDSLCSLLLSENDLSNALT